MALAAIQELSEAWSVGPKSIESALNEAFDRIGFTDKYVDDRTADACSGRLHEGWVIKDNIWGMITVDSLSARIFDCPVMQRLRWIHQLGFSYLVYPSAEHSRFPHSLGVYHVVSRFINSIEELANNRSNQTGRKLAKHLEIKAPESQEKMDLLHAAILHDVGHLPFSHVVEKILQSDKERFTSASQTVDEFLFLPAEKLKKLYKLSECLSLAVVLSARFRRFYSACIRREDPDATYRIAALIAGFRTDPCNRALPDVISSGLDADKIDYLWRDAEACKISLGVDVARVFLRSMFIKVPYEKIPQGLRKDDDATGQPQTVFVVNASGIDTFEEITFARSSMYQRVYQHQVTRSAERLLGRALLAVNTNSGVADETFLHDAIYLWSLNDALLLNQLVTTDTNPVSKAIARRLSNRQLPKRAGVFGQKLVEPVVDPSAILSGVEPDHIESYFKQIQGAIVNELKEDKLIGDELTNFEDAICREASGIAEMAGVQLKGVPTGSPDLVTVLPIPNLGRSGVNACFVLERDGHLTSSHEYSTSKELTDAAELNKGFGYVFTDEPWREYAFIAMRTVLYNYAHSEDSSILPMDLIVGGKEGTAKALQSGCIPRFRLDIDRSCRRSKLNLDLVRRVMRAIGKSGYYDRHPALALSWEPTRVAMDSFETLKRFNGQHGWRVTDESIIAFINQFRPQLRQNVVKLLTEITLLDRSTIAHLLRKALDKTSVSDTTRKYLAPLSPNSGQQLRMLFEHEEKLFLDEHGWISCKSIRDALGHAHKGDLIVLCDDNVSSGAQAECQLRAWFGIPRSEWDEELRSEKGIEESELLPNDQQRLRDVQVAICVCAGTDEANARLKTVCASLGLANFIGVRYGQSITTVDNAEIEPAFKAELEKIGASVLEYCRWGHDNRKTKAPETVMSACKRDAFGYSGLGGRVATMLSVPASTITALWCPGTYNGEPWVPLFLRRGYFEHLVLA
jgi:HD superfamily phosphohydrolase